jgi:ribosomal protein L31E
MWPGVRSINREDFKQYEIAVIYAQNELSADGTSYVPVGVGRMLASKIPEELKGRAVEVSHYLYDELWNMGPKKIPSEIKVNKAEGDSAQTQPEEVKVEEAKDGEEIT